MRGGLGLGLSRVATGKRRASVGFSARATAYFAAMSVLPNTGRRNLLAALIDGIEADGLAGDIDCLFIMAAHDAQAARVNAWDPAQVASVVGGMTFLQDRHYVGDGSTGYLASGFNPTVGGRKFTQNSAHMGVWCRNNVTLSTAIDVGTTSSRINSRDSASVPIRANSTTATNGTLGTATSVGHTAWSRSGSGSATGNVYRDGVSIGTISTTTAALPNSEFLIGANNSNTSGGITAAGFSTRQLAVGHWGSHLPAAKLAALRARLATYLTAVGA